MTDGEHSRILPEHQLERLINSNLTPAEAEVYKQYISKEKYVESISEFQDITFSTSIYGLVMVVAGYGVAYAAGYDWLEQRSAAERFSVGMEQTVPYMLRLVGFAVAGISAAGNEWLRQLYHRQNKTLAEIKSHAQYQTAKEKMDLLLQKKMD